MKVNKKKAKSRELFIYIADKLSNEIKYGAIMLNKAFYYIDNYNYLRTGESITAFDYVKQSNGPTPKPSQFLPLKKQLMMGGYITEEQRDYHNRKQKRCIAQTKANMTLFSKEEIQLIDRVLSALKGYNASELSDMTHKHLSWDLFDEMEDIPLYAFLITKAKVQKDDVEWAKNSISEYETI